MKTQNPIWTGLLFVALLTFTCCEDDKPCQDPSLPECENYDPCLDDRVVDAEFTVEYLTSGIAPEYQHLGNGESLLAYSELNGSYLFHQDWMVSDTMLNNSPFRAIATHPGADAYRWRIGLEAEDRLGKEVNVNFLGAFVESPPEMDIRLRVEGDSFPLCEGDDGYAEQTRQIHFVHREQSLVLGKWRGYSNENPSEPRTLEIASEQDPEPDHEGSSPDTVVIMSGLTDLECKNEPNHPYQRQGPLVIPLYRDFYTIGVGVGSGYTTCLGAVDGTDIAFARGWVQKDGRLKIVYAVLHRNEQGFEDDTCTFYTFVGERIN